MSVTIEASELTENPKPNAGQAMAFYGDGGFVIICGTPYNEETGTYRCPDCGFESDDVEEFAIGSCWVCLGEFMDEEIEAINKEEDNEQ